VTLPDYDELPLNGDGVRSGWSVFGDPTDSVGLFNQLSAEVVVAAAGHVRTGSVFSLNAPLDFFEPALFERPTLHREVQPVRERWGLNEVIDNFNPQCSSQWDSLAHVSYRSDHFYNDASLDDVLDRTRNTVAHWARRGLVGRGVLLDLARVAEEAGAPYDPGTSHAFSVEDLERARRAHGLEYQAGDILILRTGFTQWYESAGEGLRKSVASRESMRACGIEHTEAMARYLWNSHVSAIASDCPAVEVWPMDHSAESFPFGCLHQILLGQFGMAIGELWWLDELAEDCARDGRYEFLLTSAPLNYPSFGTPANALAIK
jgi:kynurenine formamidase